MEMKTVDDIFWSMMFSSAPKGAMEIKKFMKDIGCDDAAIDLFGSVASLIKPAKKMSPTRMVVCGEMEKGWGKFAVCNVMKELVKARDNLLFNVHGLCYNYGLPGLKAALNKIKPLIVVQIDTIVDKELAECFWVERTSLTNDKFYYLFADSGDFAVLESTPNIENDILHIGGGILFMKVLLPRTSYEDVMGEAAKMVSKVFIKAGSTDFRLF
jgi:hypothetical protein